MQESANWVAGNNQFVVDLLITLREERFSPHGWWCFLARSWEMSCATAAAHPTLKRSWRNTTILIVLLAATIMVATGFFEGWVVLLRVSPGFLFCTAWQQSDLFWHLGLNRQVGSGRLIQHVGLANTLTLLRGVAASFLLGSLVAGVATPTTLGFVVFLCGVATDMLDGLVARRYGTQSKLGQIMDSETDFFLYLAIALILLQNTILPLWLGVIMLLRFIVPLLAALISYFLLARPVRFGSTVWGKYAGLAQCLYFLLLLAPAQFFSVTHLLNLPLLLATLFLLIAAPIAQIVAYKRQ